MHAHHLRTKPCWRRLPVQERPLTSSSFQLTARLQDISGAAGSCSQDLQNARRWSLAVFARRKVSALRKATTFSAIYCCCVCMHTIHCTEFSRLCGTLAWCGARAGSFGVVGDQHDVYTEYPSLTRFVGFVEYKIQVSECNIQVFMPNPALQLVRNWTCNSHAMTDTHVQPWRLSSMYSTLTSQDESSDILFGSDG